MSEIYIVMINDRHHEPEAVAHRDKDKAIKDAKEIAESYCSHKEDFEEHQSEDWLYHATYSCEGDCVWVVKTKLEE